MGVERGADGREGAFTPRVPPSEHLVRPVRIDPAGVTGPTRGQTQGKRWRACAHGWYVPSETDSSDVEQRILEQAVRVVDPREAKGAMTGWASLRWRGAAYFDGVGPGLQELPVRLLRLAGGNSARKDPARWSSDQLGATEREIVRGIPCATVQRSLFDVVRYCPSVWPAVRAIDMTVAAGLISVSLFAEYVAQRPAWTGVPLTRAAVNLAIDHSWSPKETDQRLVWELVAGLPRPECNRPVFDLTGNFLGYPDLLDVDAGMVVEYDGADHLRSSRRAKDLEREERFRGHGLEYATVVGGQLWRPEALARRLLSVRRRALFLPEDRRRWTLVPPPWWNEPEPLDRRLRRTGRAEALTHI